MCQEQNNRKVVWKENKQIENGSFFQAFLGSDFHSDSDGFGCGNFNYLASFLNRKDGQIRTKSREWSKQLVNNFQTLLFLKWFFVGVSQLELRYDVDDLKDEMKSNIAKYTAQNMQTKKIEDNIGRIEAKITQLEANNYQLEENAREKNKKHVSYYFIPFLFTTMR